MALVARNKDRLAEDEDKVLDAIQERGYTCQVKTWACDLTDLAQLKKTLGEIEKFGNLEFVLYNAARVAGKPPLEESIEDIERDFKVIMRTPKSLFRVQGYANSPFTQLTNLALYETAQWAIPKLQSAPEGGSPSLFVTSTTQLYKEPLPDLVSLSMVKSAQRALVLSLNAKFGKDVHIALLSVGGIVAPDKKNTSPEAIAMRAYNMYKQPKAEWQREEEIHE